LLPEPALTCVLLAARFKGLAVHQFVLEKTPTISRPAGCKLPAMLVLSPHCSRFFFWKDPRQEAPIDLWMAFLALSGIHRF